MNSLIKNVLFSFSRTLQPIFCEPVEEVLTYEALRSASPDIQTHAQYILLSKCKLLKFAELLVPEII